MCGENVVCRTGRVKKCGVEKIKVSSLRLSRARKKERALLIFRSKTGLNTSRAALLQKRRGGKTDERFFNLLIKPETQKSPHPKKGLSVNPELSRTCERRHLFEALFAFSNILQRIF